MLHDILRPTQHQPTAVNLLHASRAINAQHLSVDPLAVLRREETAHPRDINWLTDPVKRRPSSGVLVDLLVGEVLSVGDVLLADSVVHVGLDAARRDAVDGDALVAAVDSHAADEGLDGAL